MEKLHSYQGWMGRFHEWRQAIGERFTNWRQENPETVLELIKKQVQAKSADSQDNSDYSHIYRSLYHIYISFFMFLLHFLSCLHFHSKKKKKESSFN